MYSKYPLISKLANQVGKQGFKFPLSEQRNQELLRVFCDPDTQLHGGVGRVLGGSVSVKVYISGKYLMLGYFPSSQPVNAMRFADMATIYFAKYKAPHGNSISANYLAANRGKLNHVFNTSEAEAFSDIERETDMLLFLRAIEEAAQTLKLLPSLDNATQKVTLEQVQSELSSLREITNQFIVKTEKWKSEMFNEIFKWKAKGTL